MSNEPVHTPRPLSSSETTLRAKFAESTAGQSDLMDKFAQQLITVELAVPGIYVSVLKLTAGDSATVRLDGWAWATFGCWFAALILALVSLVPRAWKVDPTIMKADPHAKGGVLGIEDFFRRSAAYKLRLLFPSALLFAIGLACAAMLVL